MSNVPPRGCSLASKISKSWTHRQHEFHHVEINRSLDADSHADSVMRGSSLASKSSKWWTQRQHEFPHIEINIRLVANPLGHRTPP